MKFKKLSLILLASVCLAGVAQANEVFLNATKKPMDIAYRIARQNVGGAVVLGPLQSARVNNMLPITVDLEGYQLAGIVPVSVEGHDIPACHTQFNKRYQCSMATDQDHPWGNLVFAVEGNELKCSAYGGVVR